MGRSAGGEAESGRVDREGWKSQSPRFIYNRLRFPSTSAVVSMRGFGRRGHVRGGWRREGSVGPSACTQRSASK